MGREAEKGESLKCPKCGSTEIATLAGSEDVKRYQCGKCLEEFVRECDRPDPVESKAEELRSMGKGKTFCAKGCGKSFGWAPARGRHEKKCKGEVENHGSIEEEVQPRPRRRRPAIASRNSVEHLSSGMMRAIQELEEKKSFHETEAQKLQAAIDTLKSL